MTIQDSARNIPWWKQTFLAMTFDDWIKLWEMKLPARVRSLLLQEIEGAWSVRPDDDILKKIRILIDIIEDTQIRHQESHMLRKELAKEAAAQLVNIALDDNGTLLATFAKEPMLFTSLLKVLTTRKYYFNDEKKQLHRQIKERLIYLYKDVQKEQNGRVPHLKNGASRDVVKANLPLLVECLCSYDLFDVIEDTADTTLALLEKIGAGQAPRISVEYFAFQEYESREHKAARQLIYLCAKREHLKTQKA